MRVTRTVAPQKEPINVDEAKDHIRIDGTEDDAYLMALVVAVRERTELRTYRSLITQTWAGKLDQFPSSDTIWVRKPPLGESAVLIHIAHPLGTVLWRRILS